MEDQRVLIRMGFSLTLLGVWQPMSLGGWGWILKKIRYLLNKHFWKIFFPFQQANRIRFPRRKNSIRVKNCKPFLLTKLDAQRRTKRASVTPAGHSMWDSTCLGSSLYLFCLSSSYFQVRVLQQSGHVLPAKELLSPEYGILEDYHCSKGLWGWKTRRALIPGITELLAFFCWWKMFASPLTS